MNVTQLVFSPTGGTQRAADMLTAAWDSPVRRVDLTDAKTDFSALPFQRDDIAVIAVPSYGGRVPASAAERLAKIAGNQARCVAVCVYGNRAYEDTLVELQDIAEHSGFRVAAAAAVIAEHSIMRQYAAGRPDRQDQEQLHGFGEKILDKLRGSAGPGPALSIPGNRPYKKSGGAGLVPKAGDSCVNCGLCAEKCPVQAIRREQIRTADHKKCISCMRCVAQCPQSARKVNGAMVSIAALAIKKACTERKQNELYL